MCPDSHSDLWHEIQKTTGENKQKKGERKRKEKLENNNNTKNDQKRWAYLIH